MPNSQPVRIRQRPVPSGFALVPLGLQRAVVSAGTVGGGQVSGLAQQVIHGAALRPDPMLLLVGSQRVLIGASRPSHIPQS